MSTIDNNYSDKRPSPDHMKKRLEARMEQLTKEDVCPAPLDGVDPSLLLKIAVGVTAHTGRDVYTVTFNSRLRPSCDLEIARRVARELGGIHEAIIMDELEQEAVKNSPVNRYYLCRRHLSSKLAGPVQVGGIRYTLDGTNEDDMHVYRPGIQALKESGIISPLAELRVTKVQARVLVSKYGTSVAFRLPIPCMVTRLSYGTALDYEVLGRIEAGEVCVRTMVPGSVRLRLHRDVAHLELDPEVFDVFMKYQEEVASRPKEIGFVYVILDAEGFRSGNMDVGLTGLS